MKTGGLLAGAVPLIALAAAGSLAPETVVSREPVGVTRVVLTAMPERYQALLAEGARVYAAKCLMCHGANGDGQGPLALNQPVPPRSFADRSWMAAHADGTFFTSILRGIPGGSMPAFAGRLREREIWAVVAFIRRFAPVRVLETPAAGSLTAAEIASLGRRLYAMNCAGCHGANGRGVGAAAAFFTRVPRDLTERDWMASRSDDQLGDIIRSGVAGSPMPGFGNDLTDDRVAAIVVHLRQISGPAAGPELQAGPGQTVFLENCAPCHGVHGDGAGPGANQLAPRPREFRNPYWMAGQTDGKLRTAVVYGRPGTAMPPFRALLTPAEIDAVVGYVRRFASGVPGGSASGRVATDKLPGAEIYSAAPREPPAPRGRR